MTSEEVLLLLKAGYTKAEIDAMSADGAGSPEPEKKNEPTKPKEPAKPNEPEKKNEPAKPNEPEKQQTPDFSAVLSAINGMGDRIVTALQRASLGGAVLPDADPEHDISAVMAKIISPYEDDNKNGGV